MIPLQRILVLLILVTHINHLKNVHCTSTNFSGSSFTLQQHSSENSFRLNSGISSVSEQNKNSRNGGDGSIASVVPSFSYQFHTNDHEHLDRIVLAHQKNNDPVSNGGSGSLSSNSGSNRFSSAGANLETVSSTSASAARRHDEFPSSPYLNLNSFGAALTPTSYAPYQQPQQNQDWRSGYINNNNKNGAYQSLSQQTSQQNLLPSPPAVSQRGAALASSPANGDIVSSSKKTPNSQKQQWGNVSAAGGGNRLRPSVKNALKHRNSIQKRNSTLSYTRPRYSNPITHYQLLAPGSSLNNQNVSFQGQPAKSPHSSGPVSGIQKSTTRRKKQGKRKILTSRADTYQPYDETDDDDDDDEAMNMMDDDDSYSNYNHDHEHYANDTDDDENDEDDGDNNNDQQYYFGQQQLSQNGNLPAALRDIPPGGGGFGGGFGGGGPGPLPPPPVPVKGSIDYILIPLILIGLAGPIFVVLYVVLGAFEFRIAPIARSLKGSYTDYQPYIDTVTSTVGRALEKYECVDYATCKVRGFCSQFDILSSSNSGSLLSLNSLESTLSSYTPSEYKETLKEAIKLLRNGEKDNCEKYKCSSILGKLSVNS